MARVRNDACAAVSGTTSVAHIISLIGPRSDTRKGILSGLGCRVACGDLMHNVLTKCMDHIKYTG